MPAYRVTVSKVIRDDLYFTVHPNLGEAQAQVARLHQEVNLAGLEVYIEPEEDPVHYSEWEDEHKEDKEENDDSQ